MSMFTGCSATVHIAFLTPGVSFLKPTYRDSCDLNPKFATIGERLQFMRADNAKLRPKLRPKLVKFTPQLEVDYTL